MMKTLKKIMLFTIICMAITVGNGKAQSQPEISDSIYSNELKELRKIKIKLPDNFKLGSTDKFDVIYITDGEWNMELFNNTFKFVFSEKYMPAVMLVAIPNTYIDGINMRDRDFLPHQVADNKMAGGADKFIAFIKNELMPYINKNYPTNGNNSLFGHSYGGLFSVYTFLTQPDLFSTYYSTDPALWWDNEYIRNIAVKKFESTTSFEKTLWIAGITETYKGMGIYNMDSVLKITAPKNLYWKVATFPNETHNSVKYKAIYDGFKFVYDGFGGNGIIFHPMAGVLLKDKPADIYIYTDFSTVKYTTDGLEPNINSAPASQLLHVTAPAQLALKSFGGNKKYGTIAKGNFILGEVFPSITKLKNVSNGGLTYSYYEGKWDSLPDFSKLKPVKTGIADSALNISKIKSPTNFACVLEGYYKIETDGYYAFGLDSDDGSKFYLNGQLLINNDGLHAMGNFKSYIVPLQKGFYPIKIEFFQREGGLDLQLVYITSEMQQPLPIPYSLQYHKD